MTYLIIAAILAPIFIAAILAVINYSTGSVDGMDGAFATLVGIVVAAIWPVTFSSLALAGAGYFLFKKFNSAIEKFMEKMK